MTGDYKIYEIEVVHPGIAYDWKPDSTGLKVVTNLTAKDINYRGKDPLFKSDKAVWGWAKSLQARGVYNG